MRRRSLTTSPRPSMEKCPAVWEEGNTSLPGRLRRGAERATPEPQPTWEQVQPGHPATHQPTFLATMFTGLSAGLVATFTITLALKTY